VYVAVLFGARSVYVFWQLQPSRYLVNRYFVTSVTLLTKPTAKRRIARCASYCEHVRKLITEHPLISHKLTALRDERTDSPTFRRLADELVTLLAYEATRSIRVETVTVQTPVASAQGVRLAAPTPVVIPILRAGLGMLDGMTRLLPTAEVGFLGMVRDHDTLQPTTYADRIPGDLKGRQVFLLDPMLATGGTLIAAIDLMLERGANQITAICLLSAPEGIAAVEAALAGRDADVTLVTAAVDEKLNEKGYIVPGLGDAGDRLFGVV
jgi:uracil phosphoribosyltransferase